MMDQLIGNTQVKTFLENALKSERLGQTYLFSGPEGVGKFQFALAFAQKVLNSPKVLSGNHPDIHIYRPEGKLAFHTVETFRELRKKAHEKPYEGVKKVFIIDAIDQTLPEGANALLKTFEEPPEDTLIFLITSKPERVIKTIHSRCRKVFFRPIPTELIADFLKKKDPELSPEQIEEAALLSGGSLSTALELLYEENSLTHPLIEVLTQGGFRSYLDLNSLCQEIQKDFASKKQELEEQAAQALTPKGQELTALDKGALAKQIEGMVSLKLLDRFDRILTLILSYYRDLEVAFLAKEPSLLRLKKWETQIEASVQGGRRQDLDEVSKILTDARLAYRRSLPIAACFEDLFMKLNFI